MGLSDDLLCRTDRMYEVCRTVPLMPKFGSFSKILRIPSYFTAPKAAHFNCQVQKPLRHVKEAMSIFQLQFIACFWFQRDFTD